MTSFFLYLENINSFQKLFMRKIFLFVLFTGFFSNYFGQITTSVNPTVAQMQALLQGSGVIVSGLTITCPAGAYATFGNGAGTLGGSLNSGILLTTGTASAVAGPNPNTTGNNLSYDTGSPGSPLGDALSGGTTFDGCYITFLITPSCATLSINYVFASEEFPEYTSPTPPIINDVFGFVLTGPNPAGGNFNQTNIATLPGTTTPVSIQNVNNGTSNTGPCVNCAYYVGAPPDLEYDGCTTVLTASATVTPCQTYTMTIGVWDDSDGVYDSGVFLDVNGLSCSNVPNITAAVNPSVICTTQSVTLTASGASASGTYSWTAPASGGLSATTGSVIVANPTATTTYSVLYSDINTCPGLPIVIPVDLTFTTTPAFAVTSSPTNSICSGQSATLTATGGAGTYSWTPATFLSSSTGSAVVTTPTVTTTYSVTKTTTLGCTSTTVVTINVNPPPPIAITPSLSTICSGQSVALSSSGPGPFVWTASTGTNPASAANVTVSPTTSTTYTVISGTGSCTTSAVATVSISASPSINITPSNTTICVGENVILTSSGAGPFAWTASSGANPPSTGTINVTPTTTTTYTVLSGTGSCTASAIATVSISVTPSITITPSNTLICLGENVVLTSTGAGPFTWTASSGANPTGSATVTVTPTTTTTYTVLSGTGACTVSAVASVSIAPSLSINITPSDTTICIGASVTLSSSGAGPFTWTASSGTNPPSTGTVNVTPTISTTYTVLSGTGACTASAVASISISITPSISISPSNTTICSGQTVTLSSTGAGPFTWTASTGTNPAPTATVSVTPTTTTSYSVISGTGACTVTAVASISVSPTLSLTITPNNTLICNGSSTTLTATGAPSYTWFPGLSTAPSLSVNPTTTTTYSLIGTNGVCTSSATTTVTVVTVSTSVAASSSISCVGVSPATLTASGATSYSWSPVTGLSITTGSAVAATPTITTTYSVTGTTSGCVSSQTVLITVPPISTITATTSNSVICTGGSATLTAMGANTYTWSPGFMDTDTVIVNPGATTSYTVIGKTTDGCFAVPAVITVSVLPVINPTAFANSSTVCITNTVSISTSTVTSGLTYTWQPTTAIQGASNTSSIVAQPTNSATVIYTVTVSNGVCSDSDTIKLRVLTPPTGINFMTLNNDTICVGGCVTFSSTTTGSQPMAYKWLYESGVGTSSVGVAPEACYPAAGSFSVTLITNNACGTDTLVKSNYITVYDYPVLTVSNDTTIKIGESAQIFASGGLSYFWSPNVNGSITCTTCSNTVVQPTLTTQYIVVASNSQYCKVQDTVIVNVDVNCGDFFIPNVFSPNGDGLNDYINVHGRCISTFNLQIFNRWGEKVFETSSLSESWDGTFRGLNMDTGVFIYKADGVSIDGQSFKLKGNITLIR